MALPPITPSPHRFVTSEQPKPTPRPSSSIRFQQRPSQSLSSQQFVPTPRFNFSSTQKPLNENATPTARYSSPLSRRPHLPPELPHKNREDIEETSSDRDEEAALDDEEHVLALSTQPIIKRRRPNPPEATTISSDPPSPSTPPTTLPYPTIEEDDSLPVQYHESKDLHPHPRFLLPNPKPRPADSPLIPSRPPLILPPRSPSPPPVVAAFFSPHRRGQKYVPGGLASTVRDWIVATSQQAHNRTHARKGEGEIWDLRFEVAEYQSGDADAGMVLVQEKERGKMWVLAGTGRGEAEVRVGCAVGVREPTWEIDIGGESWRVGVEWKVLAG